MTTLIIVLIIAIVFGFLAYLGYTLGAIYNRQGTNHFGKYKIKTLVKEGITYYVPICYCGKLLWKSYWSPIYYNVSTIRDGAIEIADDVYGWKNKMECIEYIENRWKNTIENRKFEEQINNLTKDI